MSIPYKSHEPALIEAFKNTQWQPEIEPITHSDMITTGGTMYRSQIKISFLRKTGTFMRFFIYIPGSTMSEQLNLTKNEQELVAQWLNSVDLSEGASK
jgi:hypothetical protein